MGWSGMRLSVASRGTLDPTRPYVFMANHLSTVDIFALVVALPVPFRFIAKKQLGAIPLFGWAMRAGRFIFIDRQNPTRARRSIEEAARRIGAGQSVVIFPEGTRSRDGRLGPFKKGGFHLAASSGADIVPIAIRGTRELMPRGSRVIHPGTVSIEIDGRIATASFHDNREALVAKVRGCVAEMLGEPITTDGDASSDGDARPDR